ncbi:hypothetical protein [Mucilaginibacter sp. NFX135]|uniref:hypothetical protein n=1 Tax=Mucilaginibacter sp. NFX135 TaxID=3402687 RepID=UPI003AFABEE4
MDAKLKSINRIQLLSAEEALERIFAGIDSPAVKCELFKWFAFGTTGRGKELHTLTPEELGDFMDKLPDLALALYNYHKEMQKGADK